MVCEKSTVWALVALHCACVPAMAQSPADFYRGKSISFLVGSGEGGGFDASARLAAQFLPRFLPGNPAVNVQNMPGASGLRVAEVVANVAPKDGLTIGMTQPQFALNKAMDASMRFDPAAYAWIGRLGSFNTYAVIAASAPVQSVEAAKTAPVILSASGPTGPGAVLPAALNAMIGTRFVTIKGYKSAQDSGLALDRGEVQGIGSASMEFVESKGWLRNGFAKILFTIAYERDARVAYAPSVVELMENDRDRAAMRLIVSGTRIGRAIIAPPGTPAARVQALRDAFDAMVRDPEVLAEAKKRDVEIEPIAGVAMQKTVESVMAMPSDVVERARAAIKVDP
jgi:tripartite-type tricarboxylate transporter receptor subunit TctC